MDINTEFFEGPLDLLLKIIEKDQESIYSVNICSITDQYIKIIAEHDLSLDETSSFVLMAARLLELKSRMLLPPDEEENTDPVMELRDQLAELQLFKYIAGSLREMYEENFGTFVRTNTVENVIGDSKVEFQAVNRALQGFTLQDLAVIFRFLLAKKEQRDNSEGKRMVDVRKDNYKFEEVFEKISSYISDKEECRFRDLPFVKSNTEGKITAFLAMLSLASEEKVLLNQEGEGADIYIKYIKKN